MAERRERPGEERARTWGPLGPFTADRRTYPPTAEGAVRYLPVRTGADGDVLGYLWAAETDDAASFVTAGHAGAVGAAAKGHWIRWLAERRSEGLSPLRALERAATEPVDTAGGAPAPGSAPSTAPDLATLELIARS
ncbi:hypothetical protein DFP74_3996 [Nocardiopsis sp. Huas11]|uniref:hypothetical protein n=1 Tax=Nocardiopsis sp. Huas11 TaxID=2183912 RepID=UPI000EB3A925|nr:hypothetical protein [Nocardiopsis sp. Huas11]RKS08300.1 hypothetical protein DFP74_3996 [Nocardiopsis sp. Huas11]